MTERDNILQQRLRRQFESRVADTPARDRRRLAMARHAAINAAAEKGTKRLGFGLPGFSRWAWLPAGAAASLLVVLLWPGEQPTPEAPVAEPIADEAAPHDLEILLAGKDLDFYAELEFYLWLEEEGLDEAETMDETSG